MIQETSNLYQFLRQRRYDLVLDEIQKLPERDRPPFRVLMQLAQKKIQDARDSLQKIQFDDLGDVGKAAYLEAELLVKDYEHDPEYNVYERAALAVSHNPQALYARYFILQPLIKANQDFPTLISSYDEIFADFPYETRALNRAVQYSIVHSDRKSVLQEIRKYPKSITAIPYILTARFFVHRWIGFLLVIALALLYNTPQTSVLAISLTNLILILLIAFFYFQKEPFYLSSSLLRLIIYDVIFVLVVFIFPLAPGWGR